MPENAHYLGHTPENLRRKRIKQVLVITFLALSVGLLYTLLTGNVRNIVIICGAMAVVSIAYPLVKTNHLDAAANLVVSLLTFFMLLMMWTNEGNRDEIFLVFPAIVCFAVLTGSEGIFKYLFGAIMINVILIAVASHLGWVEYPKTENNLVSVAVIVIILPVVAYVIKLLGSDLRKANLELIDYKEQLEQKVIERTQELKSSVNDLVEARSQLAEAEKMASLGRMVAGLSHEINTPVGISVTAASHLQQANDDIRYTLESGGIKKSQLEELLTNNVESARILTTNLQRVNDLISDFKDASVLQSDLRKSQFELNEHINRILETLKPRLVETDINVVFTPCPDVRVSQDPQVLAQIITNLFMNSIKHGFVEGTLPGTIHLETELIESQITLTFSDDGVGLSKQVAQQIFEPFFTTKRGEGGSGLGMHIVYNMVIHALKGTIECIPNNDKGVSFVIAFTKLEQ